MKHQPDKTRREPAEAAPRQHSRWHRLWMLLALLALLLAAGGGAALYWLNQPLTLRQDPVELQIEPGAAPREIAANLVEAGVQTRPWLLYQWFRWSGEARRIRAGSYEFGAGITPVALLRKIVNGDETLATLRLLEGWTFRQVRAELARSADLRHDSAGMDEAQLMAALGAPGVPAEGRFFPDTYAFSKGSSDLHLLNRARLAMQRRLDAVWAQRSADLPLKEPTQALILASIVEKETGQAADRGQIAGVFINRLRLGMPLQTDPTVIYGLGEAFDGNLRRRDLQADTPFNTYTRPGLPPTPIAMPGRDALLAATHPASTRAIYFVSRGDGSSEFSTNLADHNRAVERYQRKSRP
jgi:UPF0755 protein